MRVGVERLRQGRRVGRDKRHGLSGEAAERTLIATMAGSVLRRRALIVGMGAQLRCVAKQRLELGGDRSVVGAGESGRGQSRRRRGREKLNDQRKRDEDCGKRESERRQAALCAPSPKRKCPAPEAHQHSLRCSSSVAEWRRERNFLSAADDAPAIVPSLPEI
jgi:hypothetical protein